MTHENWLIVGLGLIVFVVGHAIEKQLVAMLGELKYLNSHQRRRDSGM